MLDFQPPTKKVPGWQLRLRVYLCFNCREKNANRTFCQIAFIQAGDLFFLGKEGYKNSIYIHMFITIYIYIYIYTNTESPETHCFE